MKAMKGLHLLMVLTVFLGTAVVFTSTTLAQDLHLLMVIDNGNPKTGQRHSLDQRKIEGLMNTQVKPMLTKEKGTTVEKAELLSNDSQATRDNILGWVQNLNLGTDDIVFVYYSGHGGADKEGANERFLKIQGNSIYRKEIVKAVEGLNCRLKIFITEVCSAGPVRPERVVTTAGEYDILRNLFLEHEGFLNVTSTSLGHVAMGDSIEGGYFTRAFMDGVLPDGLAAVDRHPQDGFVSWEEIMELTEEYLDAIYKANEPLFSGPLKARLKRINQTTQVPEVLSPFPKRIQ